MDKSVSKIEITNSKRAREIIDSAKDVKVHVDVINKNMGLFLMIDFLFH